MTRTATTHEMQFLITGRDESEAAVSSFERNVARAEAAVNGVERDLVVEADLNPEKLERQAEAVERRMDALTREPRVVMIDADTRAAEQKIAGFESWVQGVAQRISQMNPSLNVGANTAPAEERIRGFESSVQGTANRISQMKPSFDVTANTGNAESSVRNFEGSVAGTAQRISQLNPELNVRANASSAEQSVRGFEGSVAGTAQRISQMSPVLRLRADSSQGLSVVRDFGASVEATARRIDTTRPVLRTDADTSRMEGALGRARTLLVSIFEKNYKLNIDDSAARVLPTLMGDLNVAMSRFQVVGAVIASSTLPLLQAGLGGMAGLLTSAGAGVLALADAGVRAGAGVGALVASLVAGRLGLQAYAAVVRDAVKMSQDGAFASTQWAQASAVFNERLGVLRAGFQALRTELAGQTLPTLTQFVNAGIQYLPLVSTHANQLVFVLNAVAQAFLRSATSARQISIIDGLMRNAVGSTALLASIAGNAALALVNVFAAALPHGNRLLVLFSSLISQFRVWSSTVQGQAALDRIFAAGANAAVALGRAVVDVSVGLFRVGQALSASGLTGALTSGIANAAARFRDFAAAGTSGRAAIEAFGQRAAPILQAAGRLAVTLVSEFFRVASAVTQVRDSATGLPILASVLDSIARAARPIGDLLIQSFAALGPVLPPLIQNVAEFLRIIAAVTPVTVAVLRGVNALLGAFNSLPLGMREGIAQAIALTVALNGLIGVGAAVVRFFGPLVSVFRNARTEGTLLNRAFSSIGQAVSRLAGPIGQAAASVGRFVAQRAGLSALGSAFGPIATAVTRLVGPIGQVVLAVGRFVATRAALAALGVVFGPIGVAVAAVGTAFLLAYRHSQTFRNAVNQVASAIRSGLSSALQSVIGFLQSLPARASSAWNALRSGAVAAFNGLRSAASSAVSGVVGFFQALPGRVGAFLQQIPQIGIAALQALSRGAGEAVGHIVNFFTGLPARASAGWERIRQGFLDAYESAKSGAGTAVGVIADYIVGIPGRAAAGWETIKSRFTDAYENAKSGASTAASVVADYIVGIPGRASAGWETIKSRFLDAYENAKSGASTAAGVVADYIVSIPSRASSGWETIKSRFTEAYERAKSEGSSMASAVGEYIVGIPARASSGWERIKQGFVDAKDGAIAAVSSLVEGVVAKFGELRDRLAAIGSFIKENIIAPFQAGYMSVVGGSIVPDMVREVDAWVRKVPENTDQALRDLPERMGKHFRAAGEQAKKHLGGLPDAAKGAAGALATGAVVGGAQNVAGGAQPAQAQPVVQAPPAPAQAQQDPTRELADGADRSVRRMGESFDRGGQDASRRLVRHLSDLRTRGVGEMQRLQREGSAAFEGMRGGGLQQTDLLEKGSVASATRMQAENAKQFQLMQQAGTRESELLQKNSNSAVLAMQQENVKNATLQQTEGTRQFTVLQQNGTAQQNLMRDNAVKATEDMRAQNVAKTTDLQTRGTQQQTMLQQNTTTQQNLMRDNAVKATEYMRATNTTAVTNMQTEGTRQFATLQQNGTRESDTLNRNSVASMDSAQRGIVQHLTTAQTLGNQQLSTLRSSGAATMQAADPEWRTPVGNAASGVQKYLNDMLYGMQQVIEAASLNLTPPKEFQVRLTGGGGGGRAFAQGGIVGKRFAGGGIGFNSLDSGESYTVPEHQSVKTPGSYASQLFASGYRGNPNDGSETLYAPGSAMNPVYGPGSTGGGGGGSTTASVPMSFSMAYAEGGVAGQPVDAEEVALLLGRMGGQWDGGREGIAAPNSPRLHMWGEGDNEEGFLPAGLPKARALPILKTMANWYGQDVVNEHHHGHAAAFADGGLGLGYEQKLARHNAALAGGDPRMIGYVSGAGEDWSQPHWNVQPHIQARADEIAAATGTAWNSYVGHGTQGGATEDLTVDFWAAAGQGVSLTPEQGYATADIVLAKYVSDLMYIIRQGEMWRGGWFPFPEDPHYDHTHVSWGGSGGGAMGRGPNIQALVQKYFPEAANFGKSIPEQAATEIGAKSREALVAELMRHGSGGPGTAFAGGGDPAANMALGQQMAAAMGWTGAEWDALRELWMRESAWDHTADNPGSDAFGIPQGMTDGMHVMPADYMTNPASQIDWGLGYIAERYGSPSAALAFHDANGSYTRGGIATKPQMASVAEHGPEFFMPLNDPQSARQFVDFLDKVHEERGRLRPDEQGARAREAAGAGGRHLAGEQFGASLLSGMQAAGSRTMTLPNGQQVQLRDTSGDPAEVQRWNGLADATRERRYNAGRAPSAPGFSMAEDFSMVPADYWSKSKEGAEAQKATAANTRRLAEGTPVQEQHVRFAQQTADGTNRMVNGTLLARTQNEGVQRTAGGIQQMVQGTPLDQAQTAAGQQTAQNTGQIAQTLGALAGGASAGGGYAQAGGLVAGPTGQSLTNSVRNTTVDRYTDVQNTGKAQGPGAGITVGGQRFRGGGSGSGSASSDPVSQHLSAGGGANSSSGSNSGTNTQTFDVEEQGRRIRAMLASNDRDQQSVNAFGGAALRAPGRAGGTDETGEAMRREFSALRQEVGGLKEEMRRNTEATEAGHASPTKIHRDSVREFAGVTDARTLHTMGGRPAQKIFEDNFERESRKASAGGGGRR